MELVSPSFVFSLEEPEVFRKLLYPQASQARGPSVMSEQHPWAAHVLL